MGTQPLNSLDDISEYDLAYAEEDLLLQVTEQIAEYLYNNGLRQSDLAVALGVSDARVSQMMSGEANPTLKTIARVGLALNCTISLEITERKQDDQYSWSPLEVDTAPEEDSIYDLAA